MSGGRSPHIPARVKGAAYRAARHLWYLIQDALDLVRGRDPLLPPRSLMFVGAGDFRAIGEEFKRYFITLGGLTPSDTVLDVGCGIGRMAIPLTRSLAPGSEYHGIDVVAKGIRWCQRHITPRFPNFHFSHANVMNRHYNPRGTVKADQYRFPFPDRSFSFVIVTSVFTHMLPNDVEHYLDEIVRVLRPGGTVFATFFLLNHESIELMKRGASTMSFQNPASGGCFTADPSDPETATAYPEDRVRAMLETRGLQISAPVHDGSWCGRQQFLSYQDIVISRLSPM